MQLPDNMSGMQPPAPGGATSDAAFGVTNRADPGVEAEAGEQKIYDQFVSSGVLMLNDKAAASKIITSLDTEDPAEGVALVSAAIVTRVMQAAQKSNSKVPDDVLLHGISEIIENVIERSEDAGVFAFSQDEKKVQGTMIRAFDEVRVALQGMGVVTKEGSAAAMEEIRANQGMISGDAGGPATGGLMPGGMPSEAAPPPSGPTPLAGGAPPMNRQQRRAEQRRMDKGGM
jgi:hypothetical protein